MDPITYIPAYQAKYTEVVNEEVGGGPPGGDDGAISS